MGVQEDLLPFGQRRRGTDPVGGLFGKLGESSDHFQGELNGSD